MKQLTDVDRALREAADAGQVPGVVAMAATGSEVIYQGAFGKRDLGKPDAMTADTVFWIASMTKAITSAAAMQLVEQGKLSLDGPIGKILPEIAEHAGASKDSTQAASRSCAPPSVRSPSSTCSRTRPVIATTSGTPTWASTWSMPEFPA